MIPSETHTPLTASRQADLQLPTASKNRLLRFGAFAVLICIAFVGPLSEVVRLVIHKERYSYLPLVPMIVGYLIWTNRKNIRLEFSVSLPFAIVSALTAVAALCCAGLPADRTDQLAIRIFALLALLLAGSFVFVGPRIMRQLLFPIAFLAFAIPMPSTFAEGIDIFLQHASAEAAYWMLTIVRVPLLRHGVDFAMPGINIRVAEECSGYNSTFALFMVSLLAGHMFLNSPRRKILLTLAVIPLAILRNGFRITTISWLCVNVNPNMIDSAIHHHGGPFFFALSLIPFFLLLWWLRKTDIAKNAANNPIGIDRAE